jgi:hypothetical protein
MNTDVPAISREALERHWVNFMNPDDDAAKAAQEAAVAYAEAYCADHDFPPGMITERLTSAFGTYVYVHAHLAGRLLTPGEYEREFAVDLDPDAPVWVNWPYGKSADEIRLMRYGRLRESSLAHLIDFMRVWVCTGPYPGKKTGKKEDDHHGA